MRQQNNTRPVIVKYDSQKRRMGIGFLPAKIVNISQKWAISGVIAGSIRQFSVGGLPMFRRLWLALAGGLVCAGFAQAEAIDVTVSVDAPFDGEKYTVVLGNTHKLSVFGQVKPEAVDEGKDNGIFGWDVDLRVGDISIFELLTNTLHRPVRSDSSPGPWTGNSATSSDGAPTNWGLNAIYDTGEDDKNLGVGNAVQLFWINFKVISLGESRMTIEFDDTTGTDFVTWDNDIGGDYSAAVAAIRVVPEPASMSLLGVAALILIPALRRRLK